MLLNIKPRSLFSGIFMGLIAVLASDVFADPIQNPENGNNSYIERDRLETLKDTLKIKLEVATLEKQLKELHDSQKYENAMPVNMKQPITMLMHKKQSNVKRRKRRHSPKVEILTISGYANNLTAEVKVGKEVRTVSEGDTIHGIGKIVSIKEDNLVIKSHNRSRTYSF